MRPVRSRGMGLVEALVASTQLLLLLGMLAVALVSAQAWFAQANESSGLSGGAVAALSRLAADLEEGGPWVTVETGAVAIPPTGEAALNSAEGAFRTLEVVSASAAEVRVACRAYTKDGFGTSAVSRRVVVTFRRTTMTFPDAAVFAAGDADVRLDANAATDSYDSAQGSYDTTRGSEGHVGSNATSVTPVELRDDVTVEGNLRVRDGTSPEVRGNATYGEIEPLYAPLDLPPLSSPEALSSAASRGDVRVESGVTVLDPGRYGHVEVDQSAEVVLNAGTYLLDSLRLDQNARLRVVNGQAVVFVREAARFFKNAEVNPASGSVEDSTTLLLIADGRYTGSSEIRLDGDSRTLGLIYAPQSEVRLDANAVLYGAAIGHDARLYQNAVIHYDQAARTVDLLRAAGTPGDDLEIASWQGW